MTELECLIKRSLNYYNYEKNTSITIVICFEYQCHFGTRSNN